MTFPALQLPLYGLPDKGRPVLAVTQDSLDPVECSLRKSGLHVVGPEFFSSHGVISHMRY